MPDKPEDKPWEPSAPGSLRDSEILPELFRKFTAEVRGMFAQFNQKLDRVAERVEGLALDVAEDRRRIEDHEERLPAAAAG